MKKIYFLICFFCALIMNSNAQLILHEPFNYTPDPSLGLSVQSGLVWSTVNTGDSILVASGNLTYGSLPASTGNKIKFDDAGTDYYRIFAAQSSGSVYSSFILNVTALGGMNTTGGYFTGFIQPGSTTAFGASIWTRLSTTAGRYNIGISTRSNSTVSWISTDIAPGTPVFVVAAYDIISGTANDVSRLWLNTPAVGGSEPAADITSAAGTDLAGGVERVFLRQANAAGTPFIEMDELRIGTTWASVTPSASVPSLSISSPLTAFGNVCINPTIPPVNSFTISGSNLTTANVTVAALNGYTYSTTSGGTYSTTLSLTQPGGSYTQQVFVKFTPTAVQSYSGNIAVAGGGAASSVNAAASGAGVNNAPSVTTGSASAVTSNSATAAGSIPDIGCSAITAYGIEYSMTNGFANGSGTKVASTNLAGGNFTSSLGGLTAATTYYYKAYATNSANTTYGAQQSFTTASLSPSITTTALTGFGNVCINTTAGPNSFTITGSNLTTADVTVGPLTGYTFATTTGGTYTASLTLTQPGGSYSQQVFVKLTPTAVQSYNGSIPVNGGGTGSTVNVAATGAGVNSAPSVTTGAASAITTATATLAGSITATGCSAVTVYGIEYSTTNGFADGSGTKVASTNLTGGNFSSALSGLTASTTYYYKAYATNGGGTAYGTQQSFTTSAPPPPVLTATTLAAFAATCANTTTGPNSFTINGTNLTTATITVGPLTGYTFASTAAGTYTATLTLNPSAGTYSQQVFVKFTPTAIQSYNGNIPVSGAGAATINVAATGSGVNTPATVVTGSASAITNNAATLAGDITASGCATVTTYGIEYSGINGFANGNGTRVAGSNIAGTVFSVKLSGLVQGATYYYKAYATTAAGTAYGAQQTFTVLTVPDPFIVYPVPVQKGTDLHFSMNKLKPGYYGLLFFNSDGKLVYRKDINVQGAYINHTVTIPGTFAPGAYRLQLVNNEDIIGTKSILIY